VKEKYKVREIDRGEGWEKEREEEKRKLKCQKEK
jgi:hypothetical protein